MLDKSSWLKVLPVMKEKIELSGALIPKSDWNDIYHYFYQNAPFSLTLPIVDTNKMTKVELEIFEKFKFSDIPPKVTAIQDSDQGTLVGTADGGIYSFGNSYQSFKTYPIPLQICNNDTSLSILSMGQIGPHHNALGKLILKGEDKKERVLIDSLYRPIHFSQTDIDDDGNDEYIISHFGSTNDDKVTGGLWLYKLVNNEYVAKIIGNYTGASKSIIVDLDKDGFKDIVALFAQGDERVIWFKNNGNLGFEEKTLLRFHPLYGCLDFQLQDIDEDGREDIILVNGDNADYSPIFKPYHGLRVFHQKENFKFEEKVFVHINGASKLLPLGNKKSLFGVLSLYPDLYQRPWETLQFISIDSSFKVNRFYQSSLTGNNWVIAHMDNQGNISLGQNIEIQKNIPPPRIPDSLSDVSVLKLKVHF